MQSWGAAQNTVLGGSWEACCRCQLGKEGGVSVYLDRERDGRGEGGGVRRVGCQCAHGGDVWTFCHVWSEWKV